MASSRHLVCEAVEWGELSLRPYEGVVRDLGIVKRLRQSAAERQQRALARTIEGEIIPRLMLAHSSNAASSELSRSGGQLAPHEVVEFSELVVTEPVDVGLAYVENLMLRGTALETIFLDLMSPAARRLGDLWRADACDFAQVTIGLTRIQQILSELSPPFEREGAARSSTRRALLLACPGEQHSLGLQIVQKFFRRAGWLVHPESCLDRDAIKDTVRAQRFDIVGFSISCDVFETELKAAIQLVRKHSRNRSVGIMAGGRLIADHPELVARVGADATAGDGRQAVLRLPALLGLRA